MGGKSRTTPRALSAARASGVACALALCAIAAGCRTSEPRKPLPPDPIGCAETATRTGDWRRAADLWHEIYLQDGGEDPRPCAEAARALIALGDPRSACSLLEQCLGKHPDDATLLELKGDSLAAAGFERAAEAAYERALASDPDRASVLLALGRLRVKLGLEAAAVDPLARLASSRAATPEAWELLARARHATGDSVGAFEAWQRALAVGPAEVETLVAAATVCTDAKLREQRPESTRVAQRWLERAVAIDPQCTSAHFQLGVLSEELGESEHAKEHYRRAVETNPACLEALTNLALLHARLGEEVQSREMVGRALELETDKLRREALQKILDDLERRTASGV